MISAEPVKYLPLLEEVLSAVFETVFLNGFAPTSQLSFELRAVAFPSCHVPPPKRITAPKPGGPK